MECIRNLLCDTRRSKQSILKEINCEHSLEGLMLKLKLWYFDHLMRTADSLEQTWSWENWGQQEKEVAEDKMDGWHHWLNGHEFKQTPGDSERQASLVCCNSWSCRESDTTWQLNNNKCNWSYPINYLISKKLYKCMLLWLFLS